MIRIGIDPGSSNCGIVVFEDETIIYLVCLDLRPKGCKKPSWTMIVSKLREEMTFGKLGEYIDKTELVIVEHPQRGVQMSCLVAFLIGFVPEDKIILVGKRTYCKEAYGLGHRKNKLKAETLTQHIWDKVDGKIDMTHVSWNHIADAILMVVWQISQDKFVNRQKILKRINVNIVK